MKRIGIFLLTLLTLMLMVSINVKGEFSDYLEFSDTTWRDTLFLDSISHTDTANCVYLKNITGSDVSFFPNFWGGQGLSHILPGGDTLSGGDSVMIKMVIEYSPPYIFDSVPCSLSVKIVDGPISDLIVGWYFPKPAGIVNASVQSQEQQDFQIIPMQQGFKIKSNINDYKIKIFDLNGRKVPFKWHEGNSYEINASNGVYFIKIKHGNDIMYLRKYVRIR